MEIKEIKVKVIFYSDLSLAIKEELGFKEVLGADIPIVFSDECFLVTAPKTVGELEELPNWADLCRQEDFKITDTILVKVPKDKKIKRKNKNHEQAGTRLE